MTAVLDLVECRCAPGSGCRHRGLFRATDGRDLPGLAGAIDTFAWYLLGHYPDLDELVPPDDRPVLVRW